MSEDNEIRLPPTEPPAPPSPPAPPHRPPNMEDDLTTFEGCMLALGKAIIVLAVGVFVLGALVFATCFLSMRR
jgi:hypothetical protein